ncbi:hypothetical protein C8R45DRAFT_974463, partial [Mycena sanguinolenta]
RRHGRRDRVERDDLSAARRLRLAPAPHGRRRYSPRPRLRLSTRFTFVTRLQPSFPSACFIWTSLRVILLVFRRVSIEGCSRTTPRCFQFDDLRLCGREIPACTLDSINTCISFLDSTAPTAIVLLANRGPGCHSVVPADAVVNVAVIGICGSQIETHCYATFTDPSTAPASC